MISTRRAVLADGDDLVDLWWEMQSSQLQYEARWYADIGEEAAKGFWLDHFAKLLDNDKAVVVVAQADDTLIGMIVAQESTRAPIYTLSKTTMGICSAVVNAEWRQQDVFRLMIDDIEAAARAKGIRVMKLSVHRENPAFTAYQKVGFRPEQTSMIKWLDDLPEEDDDDTGH